MPSTTELTHAYLSKHPSIKDCLKQGIVNYSKLSRKIAKELDIEKQTSIEAILIACRRYEDKLQKDQQLEKEIMDILQHSELEIKNKIVVAIIDKQHSMRSVIELEKRIRGAADTFYAIEGTKVITIIISEKYLDELNTYFDRAIKNSTKNLAMITIKSPKNLETTPGVLSYIYSLFGEHGINIVETMSCWTDTIFVISKDDISDVMNFLHL